MCKENGFTLIELLVVVAIIGVLAAIAIPQFADYKTRAFNSRAESDLRNGLTAEEAFFADNEEYITCWSSSMCQSSLPGFSVSDGVDISYVSQVSDSEYSGSSCHPKGSRTFYWQSSGGSSNLIRSLQNYGSCDASPPTIS